VKGSDFVLDLPARGTSQERDDRIVDAIEQGMHAPLNWTPLQVRARERDATIFVMPDAVMVGEPGDYVRLSMNAETAQRVAWALSGSLPTTRICDLVWDAARYHIKPQVQGPPDYDYSHMDSPERMLDYHRAIDSALANAHGDGSWNPGGIVGNVGKHWVLTNKLLGSNRVRNYGWYVERGWHVSASGRRMIQTLGGAHNGRHVDYSQQVQLVKNEIMIDGQMRDFAEVARDPELCWLISSEGVLNALSIPSAARWSPEPEQPVEAPDENTPSNTPGSRPTDEPVKQLVYKRLLYRGCAPADDVGEWQAFLRVTVDNLFGPQTDGATRQFQRDMRTLVVDGIVGPKTIDKANEQIAFLDDDLVQHVLRPDRIAFKHAKNFTWASRNPDDVKWIVIHTMESTEKPTVAEAVASWFAGPDAPRASAHFNCDNDSIVQSVKCEHVAWHAPGANRHGIGIEHAGRARQTENDWNDEFSMQMLISQSIPLCAWLCKKWGVPVEFIDAEGLKAGRPGITTHHEVSQAFKKSDHWDPGPNFPMQWYLERVREIAA
jgi:hypothetical protein